MLFAKGGTNTLYLAVGSLKWKKLPTDERVYGAPILLLPVKLERSGVSDRFRLKFHEDEPKRHAPICHRAADRSSDSRCQHGFACLKTSEGEGHLRGQIRSLFEHRHRPARMRVLMDLILTTNLALQLRSHGVKAV